MVNQPQKKDLKLLTLKKNQIETDPKMLELSSKEQSQSIREDSAEESNSSVDLSRQRL